MTEAAMTKNDYAKLSYVELRKLRDDIDSLMAEKHAEAKSKLREEIVEKAKAFGFDLEELMGKRGRPRGTADGSKVEPKYRDPNSPSLVWTGRGRMPKWLKERVDTGATVEDFLIT